MKHDIDSWIRALKITVGPYNIPKFHELWSTNAENRTEVFLPTLRKFFILLHCQTSHTEFNRRKSTKLRQTVGGKSR